MPKKGTRISRLAEAAEQAGLSYSTVGHTETHAWGDRVRRQVLGCGAVVVEPRIPRIYPWGVSKSKKY